MFPIPWSLRSHGKCPPVSINSHNTCLWLFGVSPSILIVWKPRSPSNIYIYIYIMYSYLFNCFSIFRMQVATWMAYYSKLSLLPLMYLQPNVFRLPLFNPLIPQGNGTGTDQFSLHTPRNSWCGPGLHASTQTCAWWLAWHVDLAGKVFGQTALTQKANEY